MTPPTPQRFVALSLLLLLFPLGAAAVEGIGIKADRLAYDQATDSYTAEGNVRITREGVTLLADQARLRQADSTAVAEGNVQLNQGEDIIRAQRLTLNFDTQQGEVNGADVFLKKGNFHLRSERMLKTGAADYQMDRATFTTCDGDNPSWSFSARHFDVTLGEYATARNAIFSVKGVPIFYTPYLIFPVKRERQSGFLIPRFGNSSTRGVRLDTVYYWNIAPNQDATFDLDYQSKRGVGLGVDYRYIRKQGSEGSLITYGIYDKLEERGRGYVQERHQENFSPTLSLASDINLVSDRDFYRTYGEESGDYNRQYLDSTLYVSKRFEGSVLVGEVHYQENLSQDVASNRATLQRLPTVSYTVVSQRLAASPFYLSMDSQFDNFYRQEGVRGERGDLHPTLTLSGDLFGVFSASLWGGYRGRFYYTDEGPDSEIYRDDFLPDVGGLLSSSVTRVYTLGGDGLSSIKHMVVPEVSYQHVAVDNQESLPFFDYNDRIAAEHMVRYSLSSYLTGKYLQGDAPPQYRDLLYLRLSQGYQLSGSRRELLTLTDKGNPFTDLRVEARSQPLRPLTLTGDIRYNTYLHHLSTSAAGFDLGDDRGNSAGMSYLFGEDLYQYMEGRMSVGVIKPFALSYTTRYSFDRQAFLESFYSAELRQKCWSIILSFRERPGERSIFVNFTLAGVGSLLPVKAL